MRSKDIDWIHPIMKVVFSNEQEYIEKLQDTELWSATVNMPMDACRKCKFKAENHVSDITIGDNWAVKEGKQKYNKNGTSVIFVHSKKGNTRVKSLRDIHLVGYDVDLALKYNPRYQTPPDMTKEMARYSKLYRKKGLVYAHEHRRTLLQRLIVGIKNIIDLGVSKKK